MTKSVFMSEVERERRRVRWKESFKEYVVMRDVSMGNSLDQYKKSESWIL